MRQPIKQADKGESSFPDKGKNPITHMGYPTLPFAVIDAP